MAGWKHVVDSGNQDWYTSRQTASHRPQGRRWIGGYRRGLKWHLEDGCAREDEHAQRAADAVQALLRHHFEVEAVYPGANLRSTTAQRREPAAQRQMQYLRKPENISGSVRQIRSPIAGKPRAVTRT